MPLNTRIQWNAGTACVSECVLKPLACRGLRVGPSKVFSGVQRALQQGLKGKIWLNPSGPICVRPHGTVPDVCSRLWTTVGIFKTCSCTLRSWSQHFLYAAAPCQSLGFFLVCSCSFPNLQNKHAFRHARVRFQNARFRPSKENTCFEAF